MRLLSLTFLFALFSSPLWSAADQLVMSDAEKAYWNLMRLNGYKFQTLEARPEDTVAADGCMKCLQETGIVDEDNRNDVGTRYWEQTPEVKEIVKAVGNMECDSKLKPGTVNSGTASLIGERNTVYANNHAFFETDKWGHKIRLDECRFVIYDYDSDERNPVPVGYRVNPDSIPWIPKKDARDDLAVVKTAVNVGLVSPLQKKSVDRVIGRTFLYIGFHHDIESGYSVRIQKGEVKEITNAHSQKFANSNSVGGHLVDMVKESSGSILVDMVTHKVFGLNVGQVVSEKNRKYWTTGEYNNGNYVAVFKYIE